jgi:flagellar P-ring protein precursor FlgI
MRNTGLKILAAIAAVIVAAADAGAVTPQGAPPLKVRIKDVARIAGDESYTLVGYGVVAGLNNTGDSDKTLIQRTIANLMQNFNVIVAEKDIKAQNSAAVMVTATVRGSKRKGDTIEAEVSSIGDAKSITGGTLLLTPLLGADAEIWAVAQGPVTTGGYAYGGVGDGGNQQIKNHPTAGMLSNGGKLLRDIGPEFTAQDVLVYNLRRPDFTSSVNMAETINKQYFGAAISQDNATIIVRVPAVYKDENKVTAFISEIEQLYFETDAAAKVVFNEKTGTIVMGADVRISNAAVSHGNIYINIKNTQGVSQPNAFSTGGTTQVINDQRTAVEEQKNKVFELPNTTSIGELVNALNRLGVGSRDIMVIFHVLKAAGALHAELEAI